MVFIWGSRWARVEKSRARVETGGFLCLKRESDRSFLYAVRKRKILSGSSKKSVKLV